MNPSKTISAEKRDIFQVIGTYGTWQKKIFALFFVINIIGMWQNFAVTFLAPNMEFQCVGTEYQGFEGFYSTFAAGNQTQRNTSNHVHNVSQDQCHVIVPYDQTDDFTSPTEDASSVVPCTKWEYDVTFYKQTIVSEWDLVCDREWLISFAKSIYMIGFMASVLVFGQMADWVGRYPTLVVCYVITIVSGILSIFSQSYLMFVTLRFFQAFGRTGLTTTGYVLLMEIVGPERRTDLGITIQLGWSVGLVTLPALAWFVRPWVWQQVALAVPFIPLVCICWMIPESPRWLKTQRNRVKFEKVVVRACKQNGRTPEFDPDVLMSLEMPGKEETENKVRTILDLVKTPQMRKRSICMFYLWIVNAFVYYSLSYNTNDLGGDPYLNFFLSGVMEFPSYLAVYYAIRIVGRKTPLIVGMIVGGASCAAMMAVPPHIHWLTVTLAMIGKFCITGTFGILYLYTTEMFPTVVRNIALGSCSTFARVGSIVAPFARELGKSTHYTVPNGVNATLAISSGLLAFLLPETKGRKIPDTLEEGENFTNRSERILTEKKYDSFGKSS